MLQKETQNILSKSYVKPFDYNGITYPSIENAYQASRFQSNIMKQRIANMTPGEAARMSSSRNPMIKNWENRRYEIMYDILKKRFQDSDMQKILLSVTDCEIHILNSYHDNEWGECTCTYCKSLGPAKNRYGRLLSMLRDELLKKEC